MSKHTIDFDIGSGIPKRYVRNSKVDRPKTEVPPQIPTVPAEPVQKTAKKYSSSKVGLILCGVFVCLACAAIITALIVWAINEHHTPTPTPSPTTTAIVVGTTVAPATSAPADSSLLLVPIELTFRCNVRFENGTCRAVFDYETPSNVAVSVPIGANNYIEPGPPNRGQRELFKAGYHFGGATFLWNCAAHVQARWTLRSAVDGGASVAIAPSSHVECPPVPITPSPSSSTSQIGEKRRLFIEPLQ